LTHRRGRSNNAALAIASFRHLNSDFQSFSIAIGSCIK
jgi:hypothetical protein